MIKCTVIDIRPVAGGLLNATFFTRDNVGSENRSLQVDFSYSYGDVFADVQTHIITAIQALCTLEGFTFPDEYYWLVSAPSSGGSPVTTQKFFKASVAGGAGNVVFYTDTNGDGTGTALYSGLTADMLTCFVDSVTDQYSFPTITVAGNKKSVTVNVQKQSFTGITLLSTNILGAVGYANAANATAVKMIIGIDD